MPRVVKKEDAALSVSAAVLKRALAFAADHDVRYYLNGVRVAPAQAGGVNVAASNGHVLAIIHDPSGKADRATILPFSRSKHRAVLANDSDVRMTQDGTIVVADEHGLVTFIHPQPEIDGKFPNLSELLPDTTNYTQGLTSALDPGYLKMAIDVAGSYKYGRQIRFYSPPDPAKATVFQFGDGIGLVMPLRPSLPSIAEAVDGLRDASTPTTEPAAHGERANVEATASTNQEQEA